MQSENPDGVDSRANQGPIPLLRSGIIIYMAAAVLIAGACYLLGWGTIGYVATGYLYGALFLVLFGLGMTAGNLMPLQLSNVHDGTAKGGPNRDTSTENTGSVRKGAAFLATTLTAAALLGLTGLVMKLLSGGQ